MRFSSYIIFAAVLTFSLLSCSETKQLNEVGHPEWMEGTWIGTGLQLNFPQTWTIELNVSGRNYKIYYPTLDCGGEWVLVSATSTKATFIEKITKGRDKCVHNGKVIMTKIDDTHVSFSYFSPDSGKLEAHSTLVNKDVMNTIKS